MPSKQEITSVYISSNNNNLYLQWTLSQIPIADEFFRIKLTIQAADDSVEITEVILSCNTTCLTDQRVIYQLTGIVSNSLYLADITVINQYGNYSRMYQFFPQAILTDSQGFSQCTEVTGIIIALVIIIILLLLFIIILIIALCIISVRYHSKTDSQKPKQQVTSSEHIELFTNQLQPYYNTVSTNTNITSMQTELLEPTYARIDEYGKVVEERDVLDEVDSTLIGEGIRDLDYEYIKPADSTQIGEGRKDLDYEYMKPADSTQIGEGRKDLDYEYMKPADSTQIGEGRKDLDYESMKPVDSTQIGEGRKDLDYENMKSVDSTLVVTHTNVSCMLDVRIYIC